MIVPEEVLEMLETKYFINGGRLPLVTDIDYNLFSEHIANSIGKDTPLHCNTWKRVFRHLKDKDGSPQNASRNTCQCIATYLGYASWKEMMDSLEEDRSFWMKKRGINDTSGIQKITPLDLLLKRLKKGDVIEVKYSPNRILLLEFYRESCYKVVSNKNSSLEQGDVIYVDMFYIGHPLMISKVVREGKEKGRYRSADNHVIQSVKLYSQKDKYDL